MEIWGFEPQAYRLRTTLYRHYPKSLRLIKAYYDVCLYKIQWVLNHYGLLWLIKKYHKSFLGVVFRCHFFQLIRFPIDRSFQFPGRFEKNNAPRRNVYRCHIAGIVHCAGFPCPLFQRSQAPEFYHLSSGQRVSH